MNIIVTFSYSVIKSFCHFFRTKRGFTLVELLIAVTVIALIAIPSVSIYTDSLRRGRDAQRVADMEAIRSALLAFYTDHGRFPGWQDGIPTCGEFIGIRHINNTCTQAPPPVPLASIDILLAPYMNRSVPRDPLHNPTDANPRFYYAYDPYHNVSKTKECNNFEPGHPFQQASCTPSCTVLDPVRPYGVVFGFRRSETGNQEILEYETCDGSDQTLDRGHYNKVLYPCSNSNDPTHCL